VFRLRDVDGFSHQAELEEEPVTIVNFKGFSEAIPDPEPRLFDLVSELHPQPVGHIVTSEASRNGDVIRQ